MTPTSWSNLVWALFVGVVFLGLELSGLAHLAPWHTFSWTTRVDVHKWPLLYLLVVGVLWGLSIHMPTGLNLWLSLAFGTLAAAVSHVLFGWPRW